MLRNYLRILLIASIGLFFFACQKDTVSPVNETVFCDAIEQQDFDEIMPITNDYLRSLPKNQPDQNLEKLRSWLEARSCISKVEIFCNSCIKTNPAQSELIMFFKSNGQEESKTLDISMEELLKFRAYHD